MKDFLELMEEGEKLVAGCSAQAKGIANFEEKLEKFIELVANKPGYSKNRRQYLMKEAETTSDFPVLFGTVLERSLLAKYSIAKPEYRNYIKTGTQNDFRSANLIGLWGLQSGMQVVKERGEYQGDKLQDGKVAIQLSKYGRRFDLSWETLINDDLGAFSDIAERLANAALRTEYRNATKLLSDGTGPNDSLFGAALAHPIDGATINNLGSLVFSADNLGTTIQTMRTQLDAEGEPVIFDGFELVVPPAKELAALQALNPAALIATGVGAAAARQTSANVVANLDIRLNVNPFLPSIDTQHGNTAWYVFAKLSNGAAAQMNFLRGHEAPEIVQKAPNKVNGSPMDGDFEADSMAWRVRHIMGTTVIDPRLCYAQDSAT